ncbi:hypothetical protein ACWKSP_29180 [Micromonosporaceae bacterium Da 78-11]
MKWFSVRSIYRHEEQGLFEERITIWTANSFETAIELAEVEAEEYAADVGCLYLKLSQAYHFDEDPTPGVEVFSLMRRSDLDSHAYVTTFFDTGKEIT